MIHFAPLFRLDRRNATRVVAHLVALMFVLFVVPLLATDYYVSSTGNDRANGSYSSPWKTINEVNKHSYCAGDRILFEGGTTFNGNLYFTKASTGTATNPITVTSYGSSPAVIAAGNSYGLYAYNTAGFSIANINFVGSGAANNTSYGIAFYADLSGGVKLDTVLIDHVDISGFNAGIVIGAWNGLTGYKNVSITYSGTHDNATDGLNIYGYTVSSGYPNQNIYIGHTMAYNNLGVAGASKATGSGMVVGNSDGVVIERSVAYNNGANNTHNGGPVGIWAWDSNHVTLQYNESHHNHTNSTADGGGFDLDGGVMNSAMQYNYSHDNDGPGFLICEYSGARPSSYNTIRYNISQNDGRKNGAAGIHLWNGGSGVKNVNIFNNTVYMTTAGTRPKAIWLQSATSYVSIRNNIFITTSGVPVLKTAATQTGLAVQGNQYWPSGSTLNIAWGSTTYTDISNFRSATGQEMYNGSPVGAVVNPQLSAPGTGGSINNSDLLNTLSAYNPLQGSPAIDNAMWLQNWFGINPGTTDYMDSGIYRGAAYDVGAVEY